MSIAPAEVYSELLSWPQEQQLRYVRGFADGEAGPRFYSHKGANSKTYPNTRLVVFSNTDLRLLSSVQAMMLQAGIESRIYLDQKAGEKKAKKDSFVLDILRGQSIIRFEKLVGFSNPSKAAKLRKIVLSYKRLTTTVKSVPG